MATGGCEKQNVLSLFPDNQAQEITPADLRQLVNCLYDNFLDIMYIIDNPDTYESKLALSANQGAILNDKIETNTQSILTLDSTKVDENMVYTKNESDSKYYNRTQIDNNIYTKNETYDRNYIDNQLYILQQSITTINQRIDDIVRLNNLIEP